MADRGRNGVGDGVVRDGMECNGTMEHTLHKNKGIWKCGGDKEKQMESELACICIRRRKDWALGEGRIPKPV